MGRKHLDVTICKRCNRRIIRGGGPSHLKKCVATLAAQQYQRDLEALYVNDESYTTPIPAQSSESASLHTGLHHELDFLVAETPVIYNEEENDSTQKKNRRLVTLFARL